MGPCQDRVCGGVTRVLFAWEPEYVRLPISPAHVGTPVGTGTDQAGK